MHRLTQARLNKAKGILEKHKRRLQAEGMDVSMLEAELLRCWNIDLPQLKEIMVDMFNGHPDYQELAVHYIKHFSRAEFRQWFMEKNEDLCSEKKDLRVG